jgi:tetratricopeptide (TPR) repeat protein
MNFHRKLWLTGAGVLLAAKLLAADTNAPPAIPRDEVANGYLQIQEQLHATQIAVEAGRQAAAEDARKNADAMAARIQSLEATVAAQRGADAEAARKTQQLTLLLAGAFGLGGLGILLLMVYFQWRAFAQMAQISAQSHAAIANADAVHQLAAPGRATVETSNARLLDVVGRLEQRIHELEGGQKLLPATGAGKPGDLLAEGQKFLDTNAPQKALECFDQFLTAQPEHAGALVKKAAALEKLGRDEAALACCDRALAADGSLAAAYLQKGGLLNRLHRYDEALNCFEQALLAQEKKARG